MPRLIVRRSLTAVGIYSSVVFGFLGTVVATREFHSTRIFGDYATVLFATALLGTLFDLTVEEALVKYGFRYVAREQWGKLRALFRAAFGVKLAGSFAGALGLVVFAILGPSRLTVPLLLGCGLVIAYSLEGLAASALFLRSRYDIRSAFLAWSMALRLVGIAIGARYSVTWAIFGILMSQLVSTLSVGAIGWMAFHRFPRGAPEPLGDDRNEIKSFVLQSSAATGVLALRGALAPLLLGAVTNTRQVGLFRVAQAPQSAFQAISAPARMVLLTDQTRAWEHGRQDSVLRGVRRYTFVAFLLSLVAVPPLLVFIPDLIRVVNGAAYVGAADAARVLTVAAAVQVVVGWSKSLPVTIGRPKLRIWTHGVEAIVMLPLTVVLGAKWGATGAAFAVLAGLCVFAAMWAVIFLRIRPEDIPAVPAVAE
jgi:O-antigen/teichoic acid export membrane protein